MGFFLGSSLTKMYAKFFHFPDFSFQIPWYVFVLAFLISVFASTTGVWSSIRRVMDLQPAEAMKPEPPKAFRKASIEWFFRRVASGSHRAW